MSKRDTSGARPAADAAPDRLAFVPGTARHGSAGPRAVADMLHRLVPKPSRRQAALTASLMLDWTLIAGPEIAPISEPVRLVPGRAGKGGTLHLRVVPAAAIEVQHAEPLLLERIMRHLGHGVVERIRLVQGLPARGPGPRPVLRPIDRATQARIDESTAGLPDDLADALNALGTAIASAPPAARRP